MEFLGQPDFYRFKETYKLTGYDHDLTWFVDFSDQSSDIVTLRFETSFESIKEEANHLCRWAIGKHLGMLPKSSELTFNQLFSPTFLSFRLFTLELLGRSLPYHEQKGQDVNDLTCRCFGVYRQELIAILGEPGEAEHSIASLGAMTRAGIGCGSCHHDLDQLLELFGHKEEKIIQKSWRDMSEQVLSQECRDIIKPWGGSQVLGLRPGGVLIKAEKHDQSAILEAIEKELGAGLTISFR